MQSRARAIFRAIRRGAWIVRLENGKTIGGLEIQWQFCELAQKHLGGLNEETDWLLESWSFTLEALGNKPETLIGGVDWITKKWLLETFMESEGLDWNDPWLQSLDLEYHNIDPEKGLFFGVNPAKRIGEWNNSVRRTEASDHPPANTRAAGRAQAVSVVSEKRAALCDQLGFDRVRQPRFPRDGRILSKITRRRSQNFSRNLGPSVGPARIEDCRIED